MIEVYMNKNANYIYPFKNKSIKWKDYVEIE